MKKLYYDKRGYIGSLFRNKETDIKFVEDRISKSKLGAIRGFHGDDKTWKYCCCLVGGFKLVIFDLNSKITLDFFLSEEDDKCVLIPPNCLNAHQCLTSECILYYKWSEYYDLDSQWSVHYNDDTINPKWENIPHIVSDRDKNAPDVKKWINNN